MGRRSAGFRADRGSCFEEAIVKNERYLGKAARSCGKLKSRNTCKEEVLYDQENH